MYGTILHAEGVPVLCRFIRRTRKKEKAPLLTVSFLSSPSCFSPTRTGLCVGLEFCDSRRDGHERCSYKQKQPMLLYTRERFRVVGVFIKLVPVVLCAPFPPCFHAFLFLLAWTFQSSVSAHVFSAAVLRSQSRSLPLSYQPGTDGNERGRGIRS